MALSPAVVDSLTVEAPLADSRRIHRRTLLWEGRCGEQRSIGANRVTYAVKEIFLTVQGEGANIGRAAVFVRFAGCNLWSGREEDRQTAVCRFCDTDFTGGKKYNAADLAKTIGSLWPGGALPFVVFTGGEPLLQLDDALLGLLQADCWTVAVETNGTQPLPDAAIHWVCVSPKAGAPVVISRADELKLVFPQPGAMPDDFADFPAQLRWLSPMDGPDRATNTALAFNYCLAHPEWRLAIQAHKTWDVR